jgi:hypothetical protein
LGLLGRDLATCIIVDNIAENYSKQPHNGFLSTTWKDDIFDKQLLDLKEVLTFIVEHKIENVSTFIRSFNDELRKYPNLEEENHYLKVDYTKFV